MIALPSQASLFHQTGSPTSFEPWTRQRPFALPHGLQWSPLAADSRWIQAMTGCHQLAFSHQSVSRQPTHAHKFIPVRISTPIFPLDCLPTWSLDCFETLADLPPCDTQKFRHLQQPSLYWPIPSGPSPPFPFYDRASAYLTTDLFSDHLTILP